MAFMGFDEKDGAPLYDTKESAIERARMMAAWNNNADGTQIFVHRTKVPLWLAHLVRDTPLRWLAYKELK